MLKILKWVGLVLVGALVIWFTWHGVVSVRKQQMVDMSDREAAATAYVKAHSAPGVAFDLSLSKQVGNWVIFHVQPRKDLEPALLFMERVGWRWEFRALGTAFPDLYKEHPELFE